MLSPNTYFKNRLRFKKAELNMLIRALQFVQDCELFQVDLSAGEKKLFATVKARIETKKPNGGW